MPKSLVGANFADWVINQIDKRQKINSLTNQKTTEVLQYQNNNNAFVRMTSGIDINGDNVPAKKYQLFNTRFDGQFATGVNIGGNSAYGWESTSDFGFIPPPGIVSVDIKSQNRGSLREANINIIAHSLDQFDIISKLYLRIGYSVLLEWGWSKFFHNDIATEEGDESNVGNFRENYSSLDQDFILGSIWNQPLYADLVQLSIENLRKQTCGNYDGFYGRVVNYGWNLEKDGSYNITLTLKTWGDLAEGWKLNNKFPTNSQTETTPTEAPPIQNSAEKSSLNKILWKLTEKLKNDTVNEEKGYIIEKITNNDINSLTQLKANQFNEADDDAKGELLELAFSKLKGASSGVNYQFYIKLGTLLRILQNYMLLYNTQASSEDKKAIVNIDFKTNENFCFTFDRHTSVDPRVCLIPIPEEIESTSTSASPNAANESKTKSGITVEQISYVWYSAVKESGDGRIAGGGTIKTNENSSKYNEAVKKYYGLKQAKQNLEWEESKPIDVPENFASTPSLNDSVKNIFDKFLASYNQENFDGEYVEEWDGNYTGNVTIGKRFENQALVQYSVPEDTYGSRYYLVNPGINGGFVEKLTVTDSVITDQRNGITSEVTAVYNIYKHEAKFWKLSKPNQNYNAASNTQNQQNQPASNAQVGATYTKINKYSKFKYSSDKPWVGRIMEIYVNVEHIVQTLDKFIDVAKNKISVYDFLDNLMKGIEGALGSVNNFEVTYNEDINSIKIIDSTYIPGLNEVEEVKQYFTKEPTKFITHTLDINGGSFVRDANVKSKLSNNFAAQSTIGAQANGAVVGEDATALSKWNEGLVDRVIQSRSNVNSPETEKEDELQSQFESNLVAFQNYNNAVENGTITDEQIDGAKSDIVSFNKYLVGVYIKNNIIPGIGFLPIDLEITMDGLSGMKIYETFIADDRLLPKEYKDKIQFITTGISHRIQNNDWTTTINSVTSPKFSNVSVSNTTNSPSTIGGGSTSSEATNETGTPETVYNTTARNIDQMKPETQKVVNEKKDGLVVVREATGARGTPGTLWYQGKMLAYTVEDEVKKVKIKKETAIPDTQKMLNGKPYNLVFSDVTSSDWIRQTFQNFKGLNQYPAKWPTSETKIAGVRIGTSTDGVSLVDPSGNLNFSGVWFHHGASKNSSEGCIIVSSERAPNYYVKTDLAAAKKLNTFIYNNKITKLYIVNDF
jgi:hypothetical protein